MSSTRSSTGSGSGSSSITSLNFHNNAVDRLYGRDKELQHLNDLLEQSLHQEQTVVVALSGMAGVGKTSLLESQQKTWTTTRGALCALGRFSSSSVNDEKTTTYSNQPPLSAIVQALNDLVRVWSESSEEEVKDFADQMKDNAILLRQVAPHICDDLGITIHLPSDLETTSRNFGIVDHHHRHNNDTEEWNLNALKVGVRRLLSCICRASRPVVIAVDNIHHADTISWEMIQFLAHFTEVKGFLLLLAYRHEEQDSKETEEQDDENEKEVTTTIPMSRLRQIEQVTGCLVHEIPITNLNLDGVNGILSHVTERRRPDEYEQTLPLAEVVYRKTNGNPYHVCQFLQHLQEEGLLSYSIVNFRWEWSNVDCIQSTMKVSDNVSDILATSMGRLPDETQQVLIVASCLGDSVPLPVLKEFFARSSTTKQGEFKERELDEEEPRLRIHFDFVDLNATRLSKGLEEPVRMGMLNHCEKSLMYEWSHDKLRQVANSLIPYNVRGPLYVRLATILWDMSKGIEATTVKGSSIIPVDSTMIDHEWMIYMAADLFNKAAGYFDIDFDFVCSDLATLNLQASKLSLARGASYPGRDMLREGILRLDPKSQWTDHYGLSLELYSSLAEIESSLGNGDAAMVAVHQVLEHAQSLEDKFRVHIVQLQVVANGKKGRDYKAGIQLGISILALYGLKILFRPCSTMLAREKWKLKHALPAQGPEGILDLPEMKDESAIRISKILIVVSEYTAMYRLSSRDLTLPDYMFTRMLRYFCEHGVSSDMPVAMLSYATKLKIQGKLTKSFQFARIAEQLVDRYPEDNILPYKVKLGLHVTILPAMRPFHESLEVLLKSHNDSLRTGEIECSSLAVMCYSFCYLCMGLPLSPLESDVRAFGQEARQFDRPPSLVVVFDIFQQTILNLQGEAVEDPTVLKGAAMDQNLVLAQMNGHSKAMTLREVNSFRLMLACIYNDFETAKELVCEVGAYALTDGVVTRRHLRMTYLALAAVVLGRERGWCKKCQYSRLGKQLIKLFQKETAMGSTNAHPILLMLQAEANPSKERYDKAIKVTSRSGLLHHQAYMYERAGLYFQSQNTEELEGSAEFYLTQACLLYGDWGATGKVQAMKETYEFLTNSSRGSQINSSFQGRRRHEQSLTDSVKTFKVSSSMTMMPMMK